MFRDSNNIEVVNLHQTERFWLGKIDNICKVYDLGPNFKDWLLNDYRTWVRKLLGDFWEKEELDKHLASKDTGLHGFKRRHKNPPTLSQRTSSQVLCNFTNSQASEGKPA